MRAATTTLSAATRSNTRAHPVCRRCLRASSSPDPDVGPASMSLEQAEQTLCVKRGADFETVVRAKNKQLAKAGSDADKRFAVRLQIQSSETDKAVYIHVSFCAGPVFANYLHLIMRLLLFCFVSEYCVHVCGVSDGTCVSVCSLSCGTLLGEVVACVRNHHIRVNNIL
jgi:hypothetical protein